MKYYILFIFIFISSCHSNTVSTIHNCIEIKRIGLEVDRHNGSHHFIIRTQDIFPSSTVSRIIVNGIIKDSINYNKTDNDFKFITQQGSLNLYLPSYFVPFVTTTQARDSAVLQIKQSIEVVIVSNNKKYSFKPCK